MADRAAATGGRAAGRTRPAASRPPVDRAGFTLIEAMVALALSSVLVVLVSTTFLAQNEYYALQRQRSGAHDNARAVTELVAAEIRSAMPGGVTAARSDSLTIRSPMALAMVCGGSGNFAYAQIDGGEAALDEDEVAGFAVLDTATATWSYYNTTWQTIDGGNPPPAANTCAANGADTVGARNDFLRLRRLDDYHPFVPAPSSVLMIFRETTFVLRTSVLDPSLRGLFRGAYGDTLVEYATGMDTTAGFQYRRSGSSAFVDQVSGAQLADIDAVRIVADALRPRPTGGAEDVRFGWSVNVPLRNAR